jgi:hypothetical protein
VRSGIFTRSFVLLFGALSCSPPVLMTGHPATFSYASVAAKRIAFARPVVISSEIFYENRFTNQNYHSIDKGRTRDAFFRDFKHKIAAARLGWAECDPSTDSLLQEKYAYVNTVVDSLSQDIRQRLLSRNIDVLVLVYALRLYHFQSVGLRPDKTGSVTTYGTTISKNLDYCCSLIDVAGNRAVFFVPMTKIQNGPSLNILEDSIKDLFAVLTAR